MRAQGLPAGRPRPARRAGACRSLCGTRQEPCTPPAAQVTQFHRDSDVRRLRGSRPAAAAVTETQRAGTRPCARKTKNRTDADERAATADLVLRGGAVYTVDAARSWAQAVAVRDGVIVAVGADEQRPARPGPEPERSIWTAGWSCPASSTRTSTRPAGGLERLRCDLPRHSLDTTATIRHTRRPARHRGSPAAAGPSTSSLRPSPGMTSTVAPTARCS